MKDQQRQVISLKTQGLTYAAIGQQLGFSRQYAQYLARPDTKTCAAVLSRAQGQCEECHCSLTRGHVHHKRIRCEVDEFNSLDNLSYVCASCHARLDYASDIKRKSRGQYVDRKEERFWKIFNEAQNNA
jgi:hypothetical protein